MMTLPVSLAFAAAVLSTSFLSGIFGMAGGMILMGVLLLLMPVAPAMVLHAVAQMASNGWRAVLWRHHIRFDIVLRFALGSLIMTGLFSLVRLVPDKATTLILLGLTPFVGLALPARIAPDVTKRGQATLAGMVCTSIQLLAGVAGPILDVFFVRSGMDRKTLVATKGAVQTLGHFLKLGYFGELMLSAGDSVPPLAIGLAVSLAFVGTSLARRVLEAMTDAGFRTWTQRIVMAVSSVYLVRGVMLAFGL